MIFLASTSDLIQVITSAAGSIRVHSTWIDNTSGTITPGRTNIAAITTAATTTVISSPAASTYRNIKLLTVFNDSSSVSNTITIRHTDGTNPIVLWYGALAPYESVNFNENSFNKVNAAGVTITSGTTYAGDYQYFTTGTNVWNRPTTFTVSYVLVKLWGAGGGGGGGSSLVTTTVASHGGAGGGGGAYNYALFLADEIDASITVTIGAGGAGGIAGTNGTAGSAGSAGTATTFGSFLTAGAGGGGGGGAITAPSGRWW